MHLPSIPPCSLIALLLSTSPALADVGGTDGVTERVSLDETGQQATNHSDSPSISEDGRYVAFESAAPLLAADGNGVWDVYVFDRWTGAVECASRTSSGTFGNNSSKKPFISADGRWVAFETSATNLQPLDSNATSDVYLKDMQTGALTRASDAHLSPFAANDWSSTASVSDDGRFVAFLSYASDLIAVDNNGDADVFVRDMQLGTTARISEGVWGEANDGSADPMISGDGLHVTFTSHATNLVLFDNNGSTDVFVRQTGFLPKLVSRGLGGAPGNGHSFSPSVSSDGAHVAFNSAADDLVAGDTNASADVFVVEVATLAMERASLTSGQAEVVLSSHSPWISRDGRAVAFASTGTFAPYGSNGQDIFVRDLDAAKTWTASRPSGMLSNANGSSSSPRLAMGGSVLAFTSLSTNMVPGDTNGDDDVFVRTLHPDPFEYCAGASTTVQGCQPNLDTNGWPSVTSGGFFTIIGDSLPNQKTGLLFYGLEGAASKPWGSSMMCVEGAKKRTPLLTTGGNPQGANDCSGFFAFDMNGFAAGNLGGNPHASLSLVGQQVNLQFWGREGPTGTYLSTAIEYVVGP